MEPDWPKLEGGYRIPYDPRPAVESLTQAPTDQEVWNELWNELHHQGDVGEASYAAVPLLIDACRNAPRDRNFYGLIATIETERHRIANPVLPKWLEDRYQGALREAKLFALADLEGSTDPLLVRSALAVVALCSGQHELGALLAFADTSQVREVLQQWMAWSELYRGDGS